MEELLITVDYVKSILNTAEHCNVDRMTMYIREMQNTDIQNLLGPAFFYEVLNNKADTKYKGLLEGGTYEDCNKDTRQHFGVWRVLAHLAYGAYIYRAGFIDTPSGVKHKLYEDSIPAPLQELKRIRNEQRNIAMEYWKATKDYLYHSEGFDLFEQCGKCEQFCGCTKCGCNSNGDYSTHRSPRFGLVSTMKEREVLQAPGTYRANINTNKGKFVTSTNGDSYFGEPTTNGDFVIWTTDYNHPLDGLGTYRMELIYSGTGDTNDLGNYSIEDAVKVL